MAISIVPIQLDEAEILQALSIRIFTETFSAQNTPENMTAYLTEAYQLEKLQNELQNPNSSFFFIYSDQVLAGYLKVNINEAQTETIADNALEIERIYVDHALNGQGLGQALMKKAEEVAREKGREAIWLGVWEKNTRALAFYQKQGFRQVSTHSFLMGDDEQTDLIMKKELGE
ncbi:N-acetyltransferase [Enterococcus florum]|uniref:N-acetyltransferase n=1 Tax=Enterococcus florum TaxID=2480627 RepID=A0A4P5PB18_9ENTE|nr:GNAT family N-acetyltransferase [Enterococcus florum]GCF94886.1 N-acetyltransferase [Enterococcus florum]